MDNKQELRTNLVLEANSALSAIRELSDGLDKISHMRFDNVKNGFNSLTKAFEAAQKMSSKVVKVQTEDEKRFQNLLQQRARIMKEMLDGYSKDRGFAKTEKWDELRSQFESANIEIANFMKLSGRASEAVKYLQEALIAVANTPLYDPLKNQLAKLKVDLQSIKNDVKDRVSELDGTKQAKIDKTVAKELARQDKERAKDNAAAQKEEISKAKELAAIKEASDKKEIQRQKDIGKLLKDIAKLWKDIENHKGVDGQSYSKKGYDNTVNRIANLRDRAVESGLHGDAILLNPSLLNGVNTKLGQFNSRLSESKDHAQQLYLRFRETGSAVDKLNFMKAVNEFKQLDHLAEDFNNQINKTKRSALTLENIAKRAKEHFNWTAGAYVENTVLSFPSQMVESISKYELAMAGVAQVIPLAEEGQSKLNSLFNSFSDVAAKYGQSVDNALESAKSIGRMYGQGDGDHEVGATNTRLLTAQAAKMATVDNFDMLAATKGLESALSQFNLQTEDTNLLMARSNKILDVWTKLAHTSGASAQDLTDGVSKAGSAAKNAGVSFELLNSLIAVGVRSTAENGGIIGNSLKSMFSSILSDKNIKNMEQFGIQVYNIGKDGKKHLRDMQDIILDISKALSGNTKNVDVKGLREFMMPISGGKQQYSRIMAILGNYKELKRTMSEAKNSTGFADKQLELQMNTVGRKFETLKANIAKLFASSGQDGLANDLKWLLDTANRLLTALQSSETHFYKWAKWGTAIFIAWKAIPSLFNTIASAAGRFSAAWNMKNTASAASSIGSAWSTGFEASKDKQLRKIQGLEYGADSAAIDKNSASLARNTAQQNANNAVKRASWSHLMRHNKAVTIAALNTNLLGSNMLGVISKMKMLPFVATAGAGALSTLAMAGRAFGAAVAFCGGPLGALLTLISVGTALWGYFAEKEQEETEALEKKKEAIQEHIQLAQDSIENAQENVKYAELLAQRYNALVDEQKNLEKQTEQNAEADLKHTQNEEELKNMQEQLKETFHASSIEFDQDGKINQDTISNLSAAHREAMRQKLEADRKVLLSNKQKTEQAIKDNNKEIESLENLTETNWVYAQAINFVYNMQKNWRKTRMDTANSAVENIDKFIEEAEERGDSETVTRLQEQREKAVERAKTATDEYNDLNELKPGQWWFGDKIAELKAKNEKLERDQLKTIADLKKTDVMRLSNMTKTGLEGSIDGDNTTGTEHFTTTAEQQAAEKARKKAKREQARLEKQKDIVSFRTDEVMDYVNTVSKETGSLTIGQLLSFAAALNGHNDPWKVRADYFSDKNIFKVPEELTNKYSNGKTDEESRFWAFSKWMQDNLVRYGDYEGALKGYFKKLNPTISDDELSRLSDSWKNDGEYFDSKHDYNKHKSVLTHHSAYGAGYAGGDVITGSEYDYYINQMAEKYGVDKVLAHQIAEQESTHGKASSNVFQVTDSTGREMGFSDMSDPLQSIEAGLKYFAKMLENANGDVEEALRNYNGGGDPNYVQNVLRHQYTPTGGGTGNSSLWEQAESHLGDGRIDYGAGDLDKECAAFVSTVLREAGVQIVGSSNWVPDLQSQAEAQGLFHPAGDGYQPQKGDVIIWDGHTGFVDGNGHYIARNSSGMHKGDVSEAASYGFGAFKGYISLGGTSTQSAYQWKNSETGGQPTLLNWRPNRNNTVEEWLSHKQEWWKRQEQEVKMMEEDGNLAESLKNSSELARDKAKTQATYLHIVRQNALESYKRFLNLMGQDGDVQAALKRNNTTIKQLSSADIDELITRMKNSKKNVEELEKVWNVVKGFKFDSNGESEKLKQNELEARQARLAQAKAEGYMSVGEKEDYELKTLDSQYKLDSSHSVLEDPVAKQRYHYERAAILQRKLDRLNAEKEKVDQSAPAAIEELHKSVNEAQRVVEQAKANLKGAKTKEETERLTQALNDANAELDLQTKTWQDAEKYGTQAQREITEKTKEAEQALSDELRAVNDVAIEFYEKLDGGIKTMFSDVLIEGKSFKDSWQSLWKDIGKIALNQLLKIGMANLWKSLKVPVFTGGNGGAGAVAGVAGNALNMWAMSRQPNPQYFPMNGGYSFDPKQYSLLNMSMKQNTAGLGLLNKTNLLVNATTLAANAATTAGSVADTANTAATSATTASNVALTGSIWALNTTMATQGFKGFFPLKLATGGKIPAFATGGYTNGLIQGAGDGTSDSILTYLAHRGQFIATSNGEYIIKKSTVDKLGVGFLDTLNNNPESIRALKGLKRYASGGNLGDSYSPSMTLKGIEGYKTFNKANMEKQMSFSTRKMETLLQGLREDVQEGNRGEGTVTQPVILNTQADSASVMKALADNPRAVQAILGKQSRMGFR